MSTVNQPRRPAGQPTGGQWAPIGHDEPDVVLGKNEPIEAEEVKRSTRWNGEQVLYKLDKAVEVNDFDDRKPFDYVLVSAVHVFPEGSTETFVFPADERGEPTDWRELPGSIYDGYDIEGAIKAFKRAASR